MSTPVGHWEVTFYQDNSPDFHLYGTQRICFLEDGTLYCTTYPDWQGHWFQKGVAKPGSGNRVRLVANFWGGAGNDGAELHFVHENLMTGFWSEWEDGYHEAYWATAVLRRERTLCPPAPTLDAKDEETLRRLRESPPILGPFKG